MRIACAFAGWGLMVVAVSAQPPTSPAPPVLPTPAVPTLPEPLPAPAAMLPQGTLPSSLMKPASDFAVERTEGVEPAPISTLLEEPLPPGDEVAVPPSFGFRRADRHELGFLYSGGDGRFNIIDWQSRPDWDSLFNLADQRCGFECDFMAELGFNIHWWSGPTTNANQPPGPDLPPRVYDLYADLGWQQRWCQWFATEVRVQPGLYTDFNVTPPDGFRSPGHALGVIHVTDELQLVAGAVYLARNQVKWLPAGGVLWRPTPTVEARLVFPEPKIAVQINSTHCIWTYVRGEYGGGRWGVDTDPGGRDWVEYSDLRIAWGLEFRTEWMKHLCDNAVELGKVGFIEVAYVFDRELNFTNGRPNFYPTDGWRLSVGRTW